MIEKTLRVRSNFLNEVNRKIYYKQNLFTGISYIFDKYGVFLELLQIQTGKVIGGSNERLFPSEECLRLDENTSLALEFVEEWKDYYDVYTLDDELFEGIIYLFDNDGSISDEEKYVFGNPIAGMYWYPSGQIKHCDLGDGKSTYWYESGRIRAEGNSGSGLSWGYTDESLLKSFLLHENTMFDVEKLRRYQLSDRLKLIGLGINDQVLDLILIDDKVKDLHTLVLSNTTTTEKKLLGIDFSELKQLDMEQNINLTEGFAESFGTAYPGCKLAFSSGILFK